jgi:hypothetical protein
VQINPAAALREFVVDSEKPWRVCPEGKPLAVGGHHHRVITKWNDAVCLIE